MKKNSKRIYVLTVNTTTMIDEWEKERKMHSTGYCIPVTKSHKVWTNVVRICGFFETKLSLKTSYG